MLRAVPTMKKPSHEPPPAKDGPSPVESARGLDRRALLAFGLGAPLAAVASARSAEARQTRTPPEASNGLDPALARAIDAQASVQQRLVADALGNGAAYARLARLIAVAPHRLSGSPGLAAAIEWARAECERLGADSVRLEKVDVPHWERGTHCRVRIESAEGASGEVLPSLALGGSDASPVGGLAAEVIEVRSFDDLLRRADEARGRIVFHNRPMDASLVETGAAYGGAVEQRVRGAIEAAKAGAIASIVRSMGPNVDDWPHTGGMGYQAGVPRIPAAAISTRAAERLSALVARGSVRLHLEQDCGWRDTPAPSFNVVADWHGRERPDEIVLVGGHLDGWDVGDGAHDDGAGCVHSLEVARLFTRLERRPRRTLRVVLFTNEENGLAGGREYARAHAEELSAHVLALESDSGGFTPRGFGTNAGALGFAWLERIASHLAFAGAGELRSPGGGADIGPMAPAGVPLVGFRPDGQRYFDVHHTHNDTLATVSPRELHLGAGAIAAFLWTVAELEATLPRNG